MNDIKSMLTVLVTGKDFGVIKGLLDYLRENDSDRIRAIQYTKLTFEVSRLNVAIYYAVERWRIDTKQLHTPDSTVRVNQTYERSLNRAWAIFIGRLEEIFYFDICSMHEVIETTSIIADLYPDFLNHNIKSMILNVEEPLDDVMENYRRSGINPLLLAELNRKNLIAGDCPPQHADPFDDT